MFTPFTPFTPSSSGSYAARLGEIIRCFEDVSQASRSGPRFTEKDFDSLALELFAVQFQENPSYRRICERRGSSPENVMSWWNIPPVPTAAFKELDLSSISVPERRAVFYSSGTTEQRPSKHYHSFESLALYETSLLSWFKVHVLIEGEDEIQLLILTPPPSLAPHSSLVHMFETVRQAFGTKESIFAGRLDEHGMWKLDMEKAVAGLEAALGSRRPVLLLGTAFSYVHLLDYLGRNKLHYLLPKNSRLLETGGYKGKSRDLSKPNLYVLLARYLGILQFQIVCEYGMCELSSQAYDWNVTLGSVPATTSRIQSDRRVFHFPPWVRVRIISPETNKEVPEGETGLIQVFDLANIGSVLAVQTEDLGVRRKDGFELIGRATTAEPRGCSLMNF